MPIYSRLLLLTILMTNFGCTTTSAENTADQKTTEAPASPATAVEAIKIAGLPEEIQAYSTWLKINKNPIPPNSASPHTPGNGHKNIFVNQKQETLLTNGQHQFPYPNGTLVVKEAIHAEKQFVELIAVMKKIEGQDSEHGDWQFREYTRSSPDSAFKLAFKDATCWGCHSSAQKSDWVFTQLEE